MIYSRTGHIAKAELELRLALRWKPNDQEALSTINILEQLQSRANSN